MDFNSKRVLVISHNVFSTSGNMGKTMMEILDCVSEKDIAQLYFHSERPIVDCCTNYFRITDPDMLKSAVYRRPIYKIFGKDDIDKSAENSRTDKGTVGKIYQFARRRTPLIYMMRNLLWSVGVWKSEALYSWIEEFKPDVIFFASGDYIFPYKMAYDISVKYNIPILTWCCDDYYIGKLKGKSPLYYLNRKMLLNWVRKIMTRTAKIITISDKMEVDYSKLFDKDAVTIRISSKDNPHKKPIEERQGIYYIGNLGINRITPLLEIGRQLKNAGIEGYDKVEVYSGEARPEILEQLTEENGICFKGRVSSEQVEILQGQAKYLLHLEASDHKSVVRTRYSLSTKIGESLQSGACLIAYGPSEISSMQYLNKHEAACFSSNAEDITGYINRLENNSEEYEAITGRALKLAETYHNKESNNDLMRQLLADL